MTPLAWPVASAPVSFGVDEIQSGDAWMPQPDEMLDWMVDIGYAGTEMGPPGFLGRGAEVRRRLEVRDLKMVGAFLPQHFSRDELAGADREWLREQLLLLREASPDGSRPLAVLCEAIDEPDRLRWSGRIGEHPEAQLSTARFRTMVDNLHRAGEAVLEEGLRAVVHPHAGTYIETAQEIEALMQRLDASLVGLCLDTGHFRFGGADPARCVRDYAAQLQHVHLKDCRIAVMDQVKAEGRDLASALERGVFTELGSGDSGIDEVVRALREIGYAGWLVVEQDQLLRPSMTREALVAGQRRNLEYLRGLGV